MPNPAAAANWAATVVRNRSFDLNRAAAPRAPRADDKTPLVDRFLPSQSGRSRGTAGDALFAAIGVGLGAVTRNLVGAVAAALAWMALVEGIVGQLVGDTFSGWLPFNAALALGGSVTNTSTELLSRWAAAVVLIGYASAFGTAAVAFTTRRDVA